MAEDTIEDLRSRLGAANAELREARARISDLNEESKTHRLSAKTAQTALETAQADLERVKAEHSAALTAAQQAAQEAATKAAEVAQKAETDTKAARAAADARIVQAELRAEAVKVGMVDPEGIKLLDTSAVTISEDGVVVIPPALFAEAAKAKPYLFTGKGNTTSTTTPPPPETPKPLDVSKMSDADFDAAVKNRAWRK